MTRKSNCVRHYWSQFTLPILFWHIAIWCAYLAYELWIETPSFSQPGLPGRHNTEIGIRVAVAISVMEISVHFFPSFWRLLGFTLVLKALAIGCGFAFAILVPNEAERVIVSAIGIAFFLGETHWMVWPALCYLLTRRSGSISGIGKDCHVGVIEGAEINGTGRDVGT